MKKLLSLTTFFLLFSLNATASEWTENAEAAATQAKEEKKITLMNFTGSDWCHWCKKIDQEIFEDQAFKDYADENLVLLKLDFPSKVPQSTELKAQNKELLEKYGVRGFPTILVLDDSGEVMGKLGYTKGGATDFLNQLKAL